MASQGELIKQAILSLPGRRRQEDLAAAMGVAQQTVSKLARGEIRVSPAQAIANPPRHSGCGAGFGVAAGPVVQP